MTTDTQSVTTPSSGSATFTVSTTAGSATVAVNDDDDPPASGVTVESITIRDSTVRLGGKDTIIECTVTLSEAAPAGGVAVSFTGEGSGWIANPNMDYSIEESDSVTDDRTQDYDTVLRGTLTIGPGETQGTVLVKVNANAHIADRSVLLNVSVKTVDGEELDTPLTATVVVRK